MDTATIEQLFSDKQMFLGVFPLDHLPTYFPEKTGAIVNLSTSQSPGSHWVGLFKEKFLEYFDPLGEPPPRSFPHPVIFNKKQIQDINSIACGLFAVNFVRRRLNGESFSSIQQSYGNLPILNDLTL